jgi:hypothetical protein
MWRIVQKAFGGSASSRPPQEAAKDPIFLGAALIDQLLGASFGVDTVELTQALRPDVKGLVEIWTRVYLAWIFRSLAAVRYGQEFSQQMTLESVRLLGGLREIEPHRGDLGSQLSFWFTTLDKAVKQEATVEQIEVPLEFFAALSFLSLDHQSPYFQNASVADDSTLILDVAQVLQSAKASGLGMIEACVEIGGPISNSL